MDTEQLALLCNFAEMAVREMEKDKLCSLQRGDSLAEEMRADGMHRAVKTLTEGLFVVDVQSPGWRILLMNEQAATFAGNDTVCHYMQSSSILFAGAVCYVFGHTVVSECREGNSTKQN